MRESAAAGGAIQYRAVVMAFLTAMGMLGSASAAAVDMRDADCDDLDVSLEPAADFRSIDCESGEERGGMERAGVSSAYIEGQDALSFIVVFHDLAGSHTYLRQTDPRGLFSGTLDLDIEGSWATSSFVSNRFTVRTFFGKLQSQPERVPCFAFARFIGRVPQTPGYRHMVGGLYCELVPSDEPVTRTRIDQMTAKIKGDML
jgi:hypothetical protein